MDAGEPDPPQPVPPDKGPGPPVDEPPGSPGAPPEDPKTPPAGDPPSGKPTELVSKAMSARSGSPAARILVVEDSKDVLDLITLALVRRGWHVEAAARAKEGLTKLAERRYDLVIAHLGLPDRRATEMLREAREAGHLAATAVLVITGQPNPENPDAYPVLRKPLDIEVLVRQAQTILGAAAASGDDEGESATVELVLYYTPPWPSSMKARRNLEQILAGYEADTVRLTVRDLVEQPDLAESDGVVFSPTLIKKSPGAPVWMLGDLSDTSAVTDLLLASGIKPR
jgi:DNA-binding response OmpR family regulator